MMTDRIEPAECQGYSAFYPSGAPRLICPYPMGSEDREKWVRGWYDAALDWITAGEQKVAHEAACRKAERNTGNVALAFKSLSYAIGHEGAENVKDLIEAMLEARS